MKYFISVLALLILFSCKNPNEEYHKAEDALDAGREFIQQSLKGKFTTANKYMLQDEDNQFWLSKSIQTFNKYSEQDKASFNKASINIIEINEIVPDSVTIIHFSNSYKKVPQKLKVIKFKDEWLVDFKYTFSGNL